MSGYNISVEDRVSSKCMPKVRIGRSKKNALRPAIAHGATVKQSGLPESKYACVKKPYEKSEAQEQLWDLQRNCSASRWVMQSCEQCNAWHVIRMKWCP